MKTNQLNYKYPDHLIAKEPAHSPRVMVSGAATEKPTEQTLAGLLSDLRPGDHLVLNDTKVLRRRLFSSQANLEILFLDSQNGMDWEVLFPAKRYNLLDKIDLGDGLEMEVIAKGRPQKVRMNRVLTEDFFNEKGDLPLPPYIQKSRNERRMRELDSQWYQTAWCASPGSYAAPTASLHFSKANITALQARGVHIHLLTLHVGLGTFLPVRCENLEDHEMHYEKVEIPATVAEQLELAKIKGEKIWCMGTTVARALESWRVGLLEKTQNDGWAGATNLFILPGFEFKMTDVLLTNFHQPQSTLLALVCAFAGQERVLSAYEWAVKNNFRLFSYGDLTVWKGPKR